MSIHPPNLIIPGFPKFGTTTLYNWLVKHPDVLGSKKGKEPFYLIDKDNPYCPKGFNFHTHGLDGYFDCFDWQKPNGKAKVVVDASTHYIYQKTALQVLSELNPKPRILLMVRKPSRRIYSNFKFGQNAVGMIDPELSFKKFYQLIQSRDVHNIRKYMRGTLVFNAAHVLDYTCYIRYAKQWKTAFGLERMKLIVLEEFQKAPRENMMELSRWLGIDPEYYRNFDFKIENQTPFYKLNWLQRAARWLHYKWPSRWLSKFIDQAKRQASVQSEGVLSFEDRDTLLRLDNMYINYNKELEKEFNVNLSVWKDQNNR